MPTLTIDNKRVQVAEGTNILEAARAAGVHIPTLCYLEKVQAIGSCRVCLVEVEGAKTLRGLLRDPGRRGDEGAHQLASACGRPAATWWS